MKRLLGFVLLTLAPYPACAGGIAQSVTVADIYFSPVANIVLIKVNPAPAGAASCSVQPFYNFNINLSDASGNQLYAALLSAMMSGKLVDIVGTGACTNSPVVEDLYSFRLMQ